MKSSLTEEVLEAWEKEVYEQMDRAIKMFEELHDIVDQSIVIHPAAVTYHSSSVKQMQSQVMSRKPKRIMARTNC